MNQRFYKWLGASLSVLLALMMFFTGMRGFQVILTGIIAFMAMLGGAFLAKYDLKSKKGVIWAYGLSGGAALTSVLFFIVPTAFDLAPKFGAAGATAGFLSGLAIHTIVHEFKHGEGAVSDLISITLHATAAGLIIGQIYSQMPSVSVLLGTAIVSHKLPAGYIIADKFKRADEGFIWPNLIPASLLGLTALVVFNLDFSMSQSLQALFFGFSAGVFIHLALDFIPEPEPESHLRKILTDEEDPLHEEIDDVKFACILSTIAGAAAVALLAFLI